MTPTAFRSILIIIGALTCNHTCALFWRKTETAEKKLGSTTTVTNNMNQHNANEQKNSFKADIKTTSSVKTEIKSSSLPDAGMSKKQFFGCLVLGAYAATQATLIYLRIVLNSQESWSNWKKELSTQDLYKISSPELLNLLKKACAHKYADMLPFAQALLTDSLDKEIRTLQAYYKLVSMLKKLHISWLFFYDAQLYDQAQSSILRLEYIQTLVAEHGLKVT